MFRSALPFLLLALAAASLPMKAQDPARLAALEASLAQNGTDGKALRELAELHYGRAIAGDRVSVEKAMEAYLSLRTLEPQAAQHVCRIGSLHAMKGRDATLPMAKLAYVQKGLEEMAQAVSMSPNDPSVRMIRIHTCASLPSQLNQLETAIQDGQHLDRMSASLPKALAQQNRSLLAAHLVRAGRDTEARQLAEQK